MSSTSACVLGIDVGTSGVRVIAIDRSGRQLAMSKFLYSEVGTGVSVDDAYRSTELWWKGVQRAIKTVVDELAQHVVVALAVDGTSGSMLPIDRTGEPLAEPLMYNDSVHDTRILASIAEVMPQESAAGGATSGLAKVMTFTNLKPHAVLHQADWIVGKLSGNFTCSDANNALKTGFDPVAMAWPEWISSAASTNILPLLPHVAKPGDQVEAVSDQVKKELGLKADVKIIAGTTDGCAAFLATGAKHTGDAVTSLGSTLTLKLLSDTPIFAPEFGVYSHRIGDIWLAGGASNTGGAVLSHFFSATELIELSANINTNVSSGLDYYPLVKPGERFPINDPDYPPRIEPRPASDSLFLHGLLEGIAEVERIAYQKLTDSGAPQVRSVRTVGGGAANAVFTRIRQSRMSVDFEPAVSEEAAYGTATLAKAAADKETLW
ncbi:MAG: FGGY-family carbohydrate kinase [Granulosicoccus sp.]|nr:FGGY-family carbohydrate kinase [Granulosicoccus sp.]